MGVKNAMMKALQEVVGKAGGSMSEASKNAILGLIDTDATDQSGKCSPLCVNQFAMLTTKQIAWLLPTPNCLVRWLKYFLCLLLLHSSSKFTRDPVFVKEIRANFSQGTVFSRSKPRVHLFWDSMPCSLNRHHP